ncbi:tubulin beta-4B chain-like [Nomia melanderi]|uniref:tubulin beta-4B chain-like n=1 Tax=Nomia melanderi TaxID=2448451 RepID=UPI001304333A|nr:tubulin beta-4B chain-like [Nomia melanderi]
MREIVHVQLGRCGNNVGGKFWQVIADEHGLTPDGTFRGDSEVLLQRINVYFSEGPGYRFAPRAVLVDSDPATASSSMSGPCGGMFKPDNFVSGRGSAANNWAKGYCTEGAELAEATLDLVRAEAEACDLMQGIQMTRSLGGGTGSGTGGLLMGKFREEYPGRIVKCYSVAPSSETSDVAVEPYNAMLALRASIECTDQCFWMDNHALHRICSRVLGIATPSHADANHLIAACMSGVTACARFPGQPSTDLGKLGVNMVPFPRLHFFVPGHAPLTSRSSARYKVLSVPELTRQLFEPSNAFAACDPAPAGAKTLTAAAIFRGAASRKRVDEQTSKLRDKSGGRFVEWIPGNVQTAICEIPPRGVSTSATLLANTSAIRAPIERLSTAFDGMFEKRAYVHWYTAEGMDEAEFLETRGAVRDLISEYREAATAATDNEQRSDNLRGE